MRAGICPRAVHPPAGAPQGAAERLKPLEPLIAQGTGAQHFTAVKSSDFRSVPPGPA